MRLRNLIAIFLALTMILSNFSRFLVYAGFELNQDYIAKVLCINRNKPALKCEGKCYLSNKIKQAEEKEKRTERENQKKSFQEAWIVKKNTSPVNPSWLYKVAFNREASPDLLKGISDILYPPPRFYSSIS